MYDYISLRPDELYSDSVSPKQFNSYFENRTEYIKRTHFSYSIEIKNWHFRIQGIQCDALGNYAFNTDEYFKKINLIEINIPQGSESILDKDIRELAKKIAAHFQWKIDWRE